MEFKFENKDDYLEAYMYMLRVNESFSYHIEKQTIQPHKTDKEIIIRLKQFNGVELDEYKQQLARPIYQSL